MADASVDPGRTPRLRAFINALPKGQALSEDVWSQRHRVIVALLFAHAVGLLIFGVVRGQSLLHVIAEVSVLVVLGVMARMNGFSRTVRSVLATGGLFAGSAILVHFSEGVIEMHFHFFVMVAVVSLYQHWTPFLFGIGFVLLHHGTMGVIDAAGVYNHAAAQRSPWEWAAIHALFIAGESAVLLVGWRFIEGATNALVRTEGEKGHLENQLRQAQKMEAVGHLAGGVAHDFNNILSVIGNYAAFLEESLPEDSEDREDAATIRGAAARGANLTRQLLTFSRKEIVKPEVVNLNRTIADYQKMFKKVLPESIDVGMSLDNELWFTKVDRGSFEQALMNLVVNARDSMPDGGNLQIQTSNVTLDEHAALLHPGLKPGPFVVLSVTDSGCGMSEDVVSQIFEPFFTTKERGSGTGLGLATVYGIVKQAGGYITVYSEPGLGSTFRVYLPRTTEVATPETQSIEPESLTGTETILVAEDEVELRRVAARILRRNGYTVLEAESGPAAVELWKKHGASIDLLLTDVVMPQMSGRELVEATSLPAIYMSGYTDDIIARQGVLGDDEDFLQKPFGEEDLLVKVRSALHKTTVSKDPFSGDPRASVLIVDDERDLQHVLRLVLTAEDFNVLPDACNGKQALELAKRYQPRFVILDYMMPTQNGAEVAPLIREVSPDSVIVAFSAGLESKPDWADEFLGKHQIPQLAPLLGRMSQVEVLS